MPAMTESDDHGKHSRLFDRVTASYAIEVTTEEDDVMILGTVVDLSPTGAFVKASLSLPEETICYVSIFQSGLEHSPRIVSQARIARVTEAGMGLEFTAMSVESIGALHTFLEALRSQD